MPKHILVADDSVTIQRVVTITFAGDEFSLASAKSADEALTLAQGHRPDLVIADSVMPGRSGYDLCQAIKAAMGNVPVLILASQGAPYDEARGRAAGADGFMQKPFDTQAMIDKANDLIAKAGGASAGPSVTAAPVVAAPPAPVVARPPAPPTSPPVAPPRAPTTPAPPPRTQTMMGMAPMAMPPPRTGAPPRTGPIPIQLPPGLSGPTPVSMPPTPPARLPTAPPPPVVSAPPAPVIAKQVAPVVLHQPAVHAVPPQPVTSLPQPPQGLPRAPMLRGTPVAGAPARAGGPAAAPAANQQQVVPQAIRAVAQAAAPMVAQAAAAELRAPSKGPEYEALTALSREIIEKICWEVIPELAEVIIKEHVDRLAKK
ncbi:MAG: response regulator [Deltaproteobacteria bacterium]|nr:response regulator [Deltaproteobacteria bacterium]